MSTQTENPVNGNICEIIKEITPIPKMNDASNGCLEEKLTNGIKSPASEISENVVLDTEKCQENKEKDSSIANVIDILADNGIKTNNKSENITNGTITEELEESITSNDGPTNYNNDLKSKQTDVDQLSLRNVANDELISKNIDESTVCETKTPAIETNNKDANKNALHFPSNVSLDKEEEITNIVSENIPKGTKTLKDGPQFEGLTASNLSNSSNDETKANESRRDETDNNQLQTSVEVTNSITSDVSRDIEMAKKNTDTINKDTVSLVMQINDGNDTKNEVVKSLETEVANDDLVPQPVLPIVSNDNEVETNDTLNETRCDETDNNQLQTSVEVINSITSDVSRDIEMAKKNTDTINKETVSLVMQINDGSDTKKEVVKSLETEVVNDNLVPQPVLPVVSNNNEVEINNTFHVETKVDTNAPQEIDERVLKPSESSDEISLVNKERNVENESMDIDSEVANIYRKNSMEIDDTESETLKDLSSDVNLAQNNSVEKDNKKTAVLDKENETNLQSDNILLDTNHDVLKPSEKADIVVTHSEGIKDSSSTIIDCNDTPIKSKTDKIGDPEVIGRALQEKESEESVILCEDMDTEDTSVPIPENNMLVKPLKPIEGCQEKVDITDEDDVKIIEKHDIIEKIEEKKDLPKKEPTKTLPVVCKLSNTLNILSDEEEESPKSEVINVPVSPKDNPSQNIDEDDDVMVIEEDSDPKESISKDDVCDNSVEDKTKLNDKIDLETGENQATNITDLMPKTKDTESVPEQPPTMDLDSTPETENKSEETSKSENLKKPLLPQNFLKTAKKNLAGMTRHELEDFCILRIVESIVDRSNLSDIKTKIKTMAQNLEEYRKKALLLTKQNRDLQVVLKSVQEEQKKRNNGPIQPLKITRSVGMQVLMNDKMDSRRKAPIPTPTPPPAATSRPVRSVTIQNKTKAPGTPPNIPVPRKVPVNNSPAKALSNVSTNSIGNTSVSPSPIAMRNPSPVQRATEKRKHTQTTCSVTVDLTDDEPPAKSNKSSSSPVRVVPSHNLLAQNRQLANNSQALNSPRKVYIPISGPQALRPPQQVVIKNSPGPRQRMNAPRATAIRPKQIPRHPAPLPDAMKQYTPPTWKNLPPAPDLKLSKVENGIVISWKIDGYPDGAYETIASYQLYAYQETSAPPNTALWKKIGDVKALPLPMACTLTQFMAGFKYYFAVRAVDIRSRLGPFSLPGSILLLNKV